MAGNLAGMAFPLFCSQMFAKLTYHWAITLFAFIAMAMIPIPYVSDCGDSLQNGSTLTIYIGSLVQGTKDPGAQQIRVSSLETIILLVILMTLR